MRSGLKQETKNFIKKPRKTYLKNMKENMSMVSHRVTKSHFIGKNTFLQRSGYTCRKETVEKMKLDLTRRWMRESKEKDTKRGLSRRSNYSRKSRNSCKSRKSVDVSVKLNLAGFEEYNFDSVFESFSRVRM